MKRLMVVILTVAGTGILTTGCEKEGFIAENDCSASYEPVVKADVDNVLTAIADKRFLAFCEARMGEWDTDMDGVLSPREAAAVRRMDLPAGGGVESLAGIEHFTGLTHLYCVRNGLRSLDLSYNTQLTSLECNSNDLAVLILPDSSRLTLLRCELNRLAALDVSGCRDLKELYCGANELTALDVSGCENLSRLECWGNLIGELDMSGNPALSVLVCQVNEMKSLDLEGCTLLRELRANCCLLQSVDISDCKDLWLCSIEDNPGDASGVFRVSAWFAAADRPAGKIPQYGFNYYFPTEWVYGDKEVRVEYEIMING